MPGIPALCPLLFVGVKNAANRSANVPAFPARPARLLVGSLGVVAMVFAAWTGWSTSLLADETSVPAAAVPAPATTSTATPAPQGKLFICGGGILPAQVLERFIALA